MNQAEYFQQNAVDGNLTPEQMVELLALPEGEITEEVKSGEPESASEPEQETKAGEGDEAAPEQEDPETTVILAKDGKHTIPFERLQEARESEKEWRQKAEDAQRQLGELQTAAEQRKADGESATKVDQQVAQATAAIEAGVDPEIFGDFSEEAIAKGIAILTKQMVADAMQQAQQQIKELVNPLLETQAKTAQEAHYQAILAKHPNAIEVAQSTQMDEWIKSKPSFVQATYRDILNKGSAAQVVELLDTYTGETSKPTVGDAAAKAAKAVAAAKAAPPTSLSEIPSGGRVAGDETEALLSMNAQQAANSLLGKSPEQIRKLLDRVI